MPTTKGARVMLRYMIEKKGSTGILSIEGEVTLQSAAQLHTLLGQALANGSSQIIIDLRHVTTADVNLFQILCHANRKAADFGKDITIRGALPDPLGSLIACAGPDILGSCTICPGKSCVWKCCVHGT